MGTPSSRAGNYFYFGAGWVHFQADVGWGTSRESMRT